VPGGVGIDILVAQLLRSEGQYASLGGGHIFHHYVQVNLLRDRVIWPGGRAVVWGELEGQARRGVVGRYDDPVVALVGDRLPEQLGVEGREGRRVGAIDHYMVESSEHPESMTDVGPCPANRLPGTMPNSRPT